MIKIKDITHTGLAKLVGTHGSNTLNRDELEVLIESALDPDKTNRRLITESIINALTVPIEWLVDHTIRAKALAIRCIWEAVNARLHGDPSWIRLLGWALHYIADWGTPQHSPISKSNPALPLIGFGTIIGGLYGGFSKKGAGLVEVLKGIAKGAFEWGLISSIPALASLAIVHSAFEERCNERWREHANLIEEQFKLVEKHRQPPKQLEQALELFEEKMNDLRRICINLKANWIYSCDKCEFADYMTKIALVMDLAIQITMM